MADAADAEARRVARLRDRAAKQAEALRANLQRRKAQARERATADSAVDALGRDQQKDASD